MFEGLLSLNCVFVSQITSAVPVYIVGTNRVSNPNPETGNVNSSLGSDCLRDGISGPSEGPVGLIVVSIYHLFYFFHEYDEMVKPEFH